MDDKLDLPEESVRQIEALLSRHPPQVLQRMFQQVIDSHRNSMASTASTASRYSALTSYTPTTSSSNLSWRSRLSVVSAFPTSMGSSSPLEMEQGPTFTPTREDMDMNSPIIFPQEKSQSDSFMFCTYCAESKTIKTFKAKSDWKKHEMRMHMTGEDWPCVVNGCNRIFDRQKDYIKHHQRYHGGRPLSDLNDIGIQLLPRRVFGCGFDKCKEVSIGWDERCDHVAKHMKNGASFEQWKYSNVIRNLIRQEALHETWKELMDCLDERLRESRSQISWRPDNSRILRQKLECCDLRPSREEVLIAALSLRADLTLDVSYQDLRPGFVTPSRDSVPNIEKLSREQRMQILVGNLNETLSKTRLATINAALLQDSNAVPEATNHQDSGVAPSFDSPAVDPSAHPISYIDVGPGPGLESLDMSQPTIPDLFLNLDPPQTPTIEEGHAQNPGFKNSGKPSNSLEWFHPNYFDATPIFEESPYYDRPSLGQKLSKPLHKIGSRLSRIPTPGLADASGTSATQL